MLRPRGVRDALRPRGPGDARDIGAGSAGGHDTQGEGAEGDRGLGEDLVRLGAGVCAGPQERARGA
eukprot:2505241-Pyramimonas_sp.AAC.1